MISYNSDKRVISIDILQAVGVFVMMLMVTALILYLLGFCCPKAEVRSVVPITTISDDSYSVNLVWHPSVLNEFLGFSSRNVECLILGKQVLLKKDGSYEEAFDGMEQEAILSALSQYLSAESK